MLPQKQKGIYTPSLYTIFWVVQICYSIVNQGYHFTILFELCLITVLYISSVTFSPQQPAHIRLNGLLDYRIVVF